MDEQIIDNNEKKFKWKLYDGDMNSNFDAPNLIDLLDSNFYVICKKINSYNELTPQKYVINNSAHISLNREIIEEVLTSMNSDEYTFYQMEMRIFLEDVLAFQYTSVVIYGGLSQQDGMLKETYCVIDRMALLPENNVIEIINALESIKFGHLDKHKYYEKIKNYDMYFIGNKALLNAEIDENGRPILKPGEKIYLTNEYKNSNIIPLFLGEISYKTQEGLERKALKVFANYYSAKKFGGNEEVICNMPLWQIKEKYNGPIIVEPHRNWWVEF